MATPEIRQQYRTIDPLQTRILTHERYSERQVDLHAICREALALTGAEALLDVGCGPGAFLHHLRAHGHTGRLAGLDQSPGMIAAATATAEAEEQSVEWFVGDANALPFHDGEWEIISARHMLYHVPDLQGALREFARVVGPDGRVLATTNAGTDHAGLNALGQDLFEHLALRVPPPVTEHFRVENARDVLQTVFADVHETIIRNAFVFPSPEPIVDYLMTIASIHRFEDNPARYRAIYDWLTKEATRRLAAMGGIWRDQKNVGVYVCRLG